MKSLPPIPSCSNENFYFHIGDYSFGFNGKDKESEFNNGAYDFGARIHDARLGRWMSMDGKYFRHFGITSYSYSASNPIYFIDSDGNDFIVSNKTSRSNVECYLKLAFGTTNGISWDSKGKLVIDREKLYASASGAAIDGKLSEDQEYLFRSFIDGQVLNSDLIIHYEENKSKVTQTSGEIDSKTYDDAKEGKARVTINLNPSQADFEKKFNDTATGTVVKADGSELTQQEKEATAFWHEVGHIHIWKKFSTLKSKHFRQTVGFENFFRRIIGATEKEGQYHGKENSSENGCEQPFDAPIKEESPEIKK
jgi:RHS repeat-associated protein